MAHIYRNALLSAIVKRLMLDLFRIALLFRLDQTLPDLLINRPRFVDLRPSVEPQDAAFRQNAGLAQRRFAHEDRDWRPVREILRRRSPAALPQRDVLVIKTIVLPRGVILANPFGSMVLIRQTFAG